MLIKLGITIASLPELRERIFTLYAIVYIEFFFFFLELMLEFKRLAIFISPQNTNYMVCLSYVFLSYEDTFGGGDTQKK